MGATERTGSSVVVGTEAEAARGLVVLLAEAAETTKRHDGGRGGGGRWETRANESGRYLTAKGIDLRDCRESRAQRVEGAVSRTNYLGVVTGNRIDVVGGRITRYRLGRGWLSRSRIETSLSKVNG